MDRFERLLHLSHIDIKAIIHYHVSKGGTGSKLNNKYKSTKIYNIKKQIENGNYGILNEFWIEIYEKGSPIIEEIPGDKEYSMVTFIYKGKEETKNIILFLEFDRKNFFDYKFERISDTELWYITIVMRNDVRFSYMLSVNDSFDDDWEERSKNLQQDELNKNSLVFKYDKEDDFIIKYVVMPKADKQIWVEENDSIVKGNLIEYKFESGIFNNERKIWVYTPLDYSSHDTSYGLLVLTDGKEYLDIGAKAVLDNLIYERKIPLLIAVFIESTENRDMELKCNEDFACFLIQEVIPWVYEKYNISNDPQNNIIGGSSLGGLTASFIGLKYSNMFGNVLSQSGSYWYKWNESDDIEKCNWIARQYKGSEKLNLKFYINVGALETQKMINMNKGLWQTLADKGYSVIYEEFKSGHDYLCWGETLANGLISLVGK